MVQMMNGYFFLAAARMVSTAQMSRLMVNSGVSQMQMDYLRGSTMWSSDMRTQMRTTLDTVIYGACDMAGLPRVDVPAEMVAAIVAVTVDPGNWMICASWIANLRPARDLKEPAETVQIERVDAGRMLTLILFADAAMRSLPEYESLSRTVGERMLLSEAAING